MLRHLLPRPAATWHVGQGIENGGFGLAVDEDGGLALGKVAPSENGCCEWAIFEIIKVGVNKGVGFAFEKILFFKDKSAATLVKTKAIFAA
ncbi:MAG: hypothetical protein IPM82_11440 [Saprospiraceae bacterium]|nr:hypothetical protein [Saprospiraceae bacterium]